MTSTRSNHGGAGIEPDAETVVVSHDWEGGESLVTTIVMTVAKLAETDPDELERLYDRIDPNSLETIFEPASGTSNRNAGQLTFQFDAYSITVHATGTVVVTRTA